MRKLANTELNRLDIQGFKKTKKTPLILVLDNIRSLHNIGSVFRTADAFLIQKIYLCGITAQPPHKDIHKTALGATESVDWEYMGNTMDAIGKLQEQDVQVISVEQAESATQLQHVKVQSDTIYALVFGNEVKGVSQDVVSASDGVVEIPQFGTKHSLNISVSAGMAIWDFWTKLNGIK